MDNEKYPIVVKTNGNAIVTTVFAGLLVAITWGTRAWMDWGWVNWIMIILFSLLFLGSLGSVRSTCYAIICPHCSTETTFPIDSDGKSCHACKIRLVKNSDGYIVSSGHVVNEDDELNS